MHAGAARPWSHVGWTGLGSCLRHTGRKYITPPPASSPFLQVEVSASFGDEVWEARNFGQVMYAMRTRVGGIYMKFKKNNGDMSALQVRHGGAQ